jgi:hypothetical protein
MVLPSPKVTIPGIRQKTLQAGLPSLITTWLLAEVLIEPVVLNTNRAFGSPKVSSVSLPVSQNNPVFET